MGYFPVSEEAVLMAGDSELCDSETSLLRAGMPLKCNFLVFYKPNAAMNFYLFLAVEAILLGF